MCGICGIVYDAPERTVDPAVLERMNAAMAHRGPDDEGVWTQGPAGLAMRRLSIIDLFRGHQPMVTSDGAKALVFNGEVYNFQEVRGELESRGHNFNTLSDTEVVLHACDEWGDEALHRFNGMFAFALYDTQRKRLLIARDRLGIKPLFYAHHQGALVFASELDALRRSGMFPTTLNPAALDAYLTFLYVPGPDTIFEEAHKLPPGHRLVHENGQLSIEPYWRLRFEPRSTWTMHSAAEKYQELLSDSVRLRMTSDVPFGAFLSGGLDSSSVVGMMGLVGDAAVKTFTIGFDDGHGAPDAQADELHYARIAAEHFGTGHTEEVMRPDMVEILPTLVRHFGEPFADSSAIPTWLVSRLARRHVTVALSGDGGDELFAGYTWAHMALNVARYRRWAPEPLRRLVETALRCAPETPFWHKVRRFSHDATLDARTVFRRRQTCFSAQQRAALYRPEIAQGVLAAACDRFSEHAERAGSISVNDWMLYQDLMMYLPDDILTKVDRMSMANSLEARVPLLDHRIVEFAATLPFSLKLGWGKSKRLPKHALKRLLPEPLLRQRKQGFAIPIHRWFRQDGVLREHFGDAVLADDARCRGLLKRQVIEGLLQSHVKERENYGHHLWAILVFEHWLRCAEEPG